MLNENLSSTVNASTSATLIGVYTMENGSEVLEMELRFTVWIGTVFICGGEDQPGTERNITLVLGETKYALYIPCAPTLMYLTSYCRTNLYNDKRYTPKYSYYPCYQPNRGG
jgi:hypothetical protein